MRLYGVALTVVMLSVVVGAQATCDRHAFKAVSGINVEENRESISLLWSGESGEQPRARFAVRNGQPMVSELAVHAESGNWVVLGHDLTPEFQVTTGRRRLSSTQLSYMKKLGIYAPEEEEKRKWNTFWDAPLVIP